MRSLPTPVLTARRPLPERMGPPSNPRTFLDHGGDNKQTD